MAIQVRIQWTVTAKESLKSLPPKVRKGLFAKVGELGNKGVDPREANKPLIGPLGGLYSIKYSRYRVIYGVKEEHITSGDVLLRLCVRVLIAGIRKQRDHKDIYAVAKKLIGLGVLNWD